MFFYNNVFCFVFCTYPSWKGILGICRHRTPNGRGRWCPCGIPSSKKFQFWRRIWPPWYCWLVECLEENVNFENFLIRYISTVLTFSLFLKIKFRYILFLICYLQLYGIVFHEHMWIVTFSNILWNSIILYKKFYENPLKTIVNVFIF